MVSSVSAEHRFAVQLLDSMDCRDARRAQSKANREAGGAHGKPHRKVVGQRELSASRTGPTRHHRPRSVPKVSSQQSMVAAEKYHHGQSNYAVLNLDAARRKAHVRPAALNQHEQAEEIGQTEWMGIGGSWPLVQSARALSRGRPLRRNIEAQPAIAALPMTVPRLFLSMHRPWQTTPSAATRTPAARRRRKGTGTRRLRRTRFSPV